MRGERVTAVEPTAAAVVEQGATRGGACSGNDGRAEGRRVAEQAAAGGESVEGREREQARVRGGSKSCDYLHESQTLQGWGRKNLSEDRRQASSTVLP